MVTASASCPPISRNQIVMQPPETIASPEASPSSPSIRLNEFRIMMIQTAVKVSDRYQGTVQPNTL